MFDGHFRVAGEASVTKLLVVDDEPDYPHFLKIILSAEGFKVETASSGTEALDTARRFMPDVLISDWKLNGKYTGLDIANALRQANPRLETILITGYTSLELQTRVNGHPHTHFLAKPFEPYEIIALTQSVLSG